MDLIKNKKVLIISPLEAKHYILDIPKVTNTYQKQAVKFALKSLYPGTEEETVIDYSFSGKKIIGIAANLQRVNSYKKTYDKIISPVFLLQNEIRDGLCILYTNEWTEFILFESGHCILIKDFISKDIINIENFIKDFVSNYKSKYKINLIYKDTDYKIIEEFLLLEKINFLKINFLDIINKLSFSRCEIFNNRKKTKYFDIFYILLIILFFLLLFISVVFKNKENKITKLSQEKKETYLNLKKSLTVNSNIVEDNSYIINTYPSLYMELCEIYEASNSLIINSFSISNNNIRFEAEDKNPILVLNNLKKSEILENLSLLQSIPQENGKEKFIITGKIK